MLQGDYQEEVDLLYFLSFHHMFGNTSARAPLGPPQVCSTSKTLDLKPRVTTELEAFPSFSISSGSTQRDFFKKQTWKSLEDFC